MCVSFSDFPFLQIGHFLAFSCVSSFSSFCSRPLFIYCSHVTIVRFLALIYWQPRASVSVWICVWLALATGGAICHESRGGSSPPSVATSATNHQTHGRCDKNNAFLSRFFPFETNRLLNECVFRRVGWRCARRRRRWCCCCTCRSRTLLRCSMWAGGESSWRTMWCGKRISFWVLSLCLSRACLGKTIVYIYISGAIAFSSRRISSWRFVSIVIVCSEPACLDQQSFLTRKLETRTELSFHFLACIRAGVGKSRGEVAGAGRCGKRMHFWDAIYI